MVRCQPILLGKLPLLTKSLNEQRNNACHFSFLLPVSSRPTLPLHGTHRHVYKACPSCNPKSAPLALAPCNLAHLLLHRNPEVPGTLLCIHEDSQCSTPSSIPTLPLPAPYIGPPPQLLHPIFYFLALLQLYQLVWLLFLIPLSTVSLLNFS